MIKTVYQSVQSLSHIQLCVTTWTAACQASLSITNSGSLLKLMSFESVMPSNHLILCPPLLLLPSIFPSIRVFSNELQTLCVNVLSILLVKNIKVFIFIFFYSSKFSQKIRYVFNLAELAELVPMEYVGIPECIKQYVVFYLFHCIWIFIF